METPTCIKRNVFNKTEARHTRMYEVYTNKEEEFMDGEVCIRTLVHVKDTSTFIQHIITERGIDPQDSTFRVAIDRSRIP